MKRNIKQRLHDIDFPKYCKQIGILESDGFRLITNRKEYNELAAKHSNAGAHKAIDRNCLGKCEYHIRAIFVNESPHLKGGVVHRTIHGKDGRMKRNYKIVPKKWNYYEQRYTLIHELVHARFPYMKHGREFDDRIDQILGGRTFEPKHIHFFAGFDKKWIYLIDGSTNEEIEAYHKKAATLKATRDAYNEKLRQYWAVRKELEDMIQQSIRRETDDAFSIKSDDGIYLDWETRTEIKDLIDKTFDRRIPIEQTIEQLRKKKEEVTSRHGNL